MSVPRLDAYELALEFPRYRCAICGTRNPTDHKYFCGVQDLDGTESDVGNEGEEVDDG